jgi:hypothetical protein
LYKICYFLQEPGASGDSFVPGVYVVLHGLKNKDEWNGRRGKLVCFDASKSRWQVQVGKQKTLSVKPINLRKVWLFLVCFVAAATCFKPAPDLFLISFTGSSKRVR